MMGELLGHYRGFDWQWSISVISGWDELGNLLMGLMECEMLKERQPLAVCPLHLEPLILSSRLKLQHGDSNSGFYLQLQLIFRRLKF